MKVHAGRGCLDDIDDDDPIDWNSFPELPRIRLKPSVEKTEPTIEHVNIPHTIVLIDWETFMRFAYGDLKWFCMPYALHPHCPKTD